MLDTQYIEELIKNIGVTKSHLTKAIGMSRSTFDLKLSGKSDFSLVQLNRLCDALRLTNEEREKILSPMFKETSTKGE